MAVTPPGAGSAGPVVQLTTLPGWRQFVTAVPSIPNLLAEPEWLSLDDGKRSAHDEERLEHHSRLVVVQTPVVGRIVKRGGDLIRMNRVAHYGRSGLMVDLDRTCPDLVIAAIGSMGTSGQDAEPVDA